MVRFLLLLLLLSLRMLQTQYSGSQELGTGGLEQLRAEHNDVRQVMKETGVRRRGCGCAVKRLTCDQLV